MGGRSSKKADYRPRPSRHAWGRIQDVNYREDEGSSEEDGYPWDRDRRVYEEPMDWPRSCPVLHLNIQEDFPLEAQRKLVRVSFWFCFLSFPFGLFLYDVLT